MKYTWDAHNGGLAHLYDEELLSDGCESATSEQERFATLIRNSETARLGCIRVDPKESWDNPPTYSAFFRGEILGDDIPTEYEAKDMVWNALIREIRGDSK